MNWKHADLGRLTVRGQLFEYRRRNPFSLSDPFLFS
jgi:hypothetical protein